MRHLSSPKARDEGHSSLSSDDTGEVSAACRGCYSGFASSSHLRFCSLPGLRTLVLVFLALPVVVHADSGFQAAPVPPEMRTGFFAIEANHERVDVAHAAANYEFVSFDITGPVEIAITAAETGILGSRRRHSALAARPARRCGRGQTIRFSLQGRPNSPSRGLATFSTTRRCCFSLPARRHRPPSGPQCHIVPAGVHRESLNPKSGDTIYLAPGAYIFGSLNLWNVENVKVLGRGTIVYDGPQDPTADEGWMQKPDWHCIGRLPGAQRGDRRPHLHSSAREPGRSR